GAMIADEECDDVVSGVDAPRYVSWVDTESSAEKPSLAALIEEGLGRHPSKPERASRTVILTSGTTGTPKGATRDSSDSTTAAMGFLDRVPFRIRDITLVAA